jgi:hypothetical protein
MERVRRTRIRIVRVPKVARFAKPSLALTWVSRLTELTTTKFGLIDQIMTAAAVQAAWRIDAQDRHNAGSDDHNDASGRKSRCVMFLVWFDVPALYYR